MAKKTEIPPLQDLYADWFSQYSTYVVLHRAVPSLEDGLKPSQRRCIFSLYEMEDGRYNKLAGVVGHTMRYHPHGDMSIIDTFVTMGQKNWLIDWQGNWGSPITGESAAAARYIEARLTPFAKEILFNPKTTEWIPSYDGRYQEPVTLPAKFPLLLLQGTDGIAVGLACSILPHNFNEICEAAVACLENKPFCLLPDFPSGGDADVSAYTDGTEKGKIRVRAKIEIQDKNTLVITDMPYGVTTGKLMENIVAITQKGKIKVKSVKDNTAESPELVIHLAPGTDPEKTREALFAFTKCEVSHSTNTGVIKDNKPWFCSTSDLLRDAVEHTKALIKQELEIRMEELETRHMRLSLEKIFIENEIYEKLKTAETFEEGVSRITNALEPFFPKLRRRPTDEEILALTEIRLRRIGKYDAAAHQAQISSTEKEEEETLRKLSRINKTTIAYFEALQKKYGKDQERKTRLHKEGFKKIDLAEVDAQSEKIYWNQAEGFLGTGLKKDEPLPFEATPMTDIAAISRNGTLKINRVGEKTFFAEALLDARPVLKNGEAPTYHLAYRDKSSGKSFVKSFQVTGGFIREKAYLLAGGKEENEVLFLHISKPGEHPPKITVILDPKERARIKEFSFDFATLPVKNREAMGNTLCRYTVKKVSLQKAGT